ncbi:MAG: ATP-binding protein [Clostridia bacterium]
MRELSLHILDIAENSLRSNAGLIEIVIKENSEKNSYKIVIRDDGSGMKKEYAQSIISPFVTERNTRKVGLGLPLFAQTAKMCSGRLCIYSKPSKGTTVVARMKRNHIDLPPLGQIEDTILSLIISSNGCDIKYTHQHDHHKYELDTREIKKRIEDDSINSPMVIKWVRGYIKENENYLKKKGALA